MYTGQLSRIWLASTSVFLAGLLVWRDCEGYRTEFDMYEVCKTRGLPTRQSTWGGFSYRPEDPDIAAAPFPQECRDGAGQPTWNGGPMLWSRPTAT
jgi:hypothetical protein